MRLAPIVLLVLSFLIISCDGKDRAYKTNKEVYESGSISKTVLEIEKYNPKEYTETVNDTVLSNGYRVHVKYYSDMNTSILKEHTKDTIRYKNYYREFDADISITLNTNTIFNNVLTKDFLIEKKVTTRKAIESLRLKNIWIDELSSFKGVSIHLIYNDISNNTIKTMHFEMLVHQNGEYSINEIKPVQT